MASPPVLSYPEKAGAGSPALGVLAAAQLAGVALEVKPLDAKTAKDAGVTLTFASGSVAAAGGVHASCAELPACPAPLH